jgi:hypothetical protein
VHQIKDSIELFLIQERLASLFLSLAPPTDTLELLSVLREMSQLLALARLHCKSLFDDASFMARHQFDPSSADPASVVLVREYSRLALAIDEKPQHQSLIESWTAALCHQSHLLCLIARLICFCSITLQGLSPSFDEDIYQFVDRKCADAGFPLLLAASSGQSTAPSSVASTDLGQVLSLIEISENSLLEMILFDWRRLCPLRSSHALEAPTGSSPIPSLSQVSSPLVEALHDEVVKGCHALPPVTWRLSAAINSFYNRIISLIGKSVDRKQFERIEGNQNRLDLIAFVITEDDRVSAPLDELLSLIGLRVAPTPFLSLTLNVEGLLDRFASVLSFELKKYLNQAIASCRRAAKSSNLAGAASLSPPWEVRTIDQSLFVGPLPELIFEIFQTFLEMAASPNSSADSSATSRLRLLNMNKVIVHSVLSAYDLLRDELHHIFEALAHLFEYIESHALPPEEADELISQNMTLLCSIANDCDRLLTIHVPQLQKRAMMALTVDTESPLVVWDQSQTYLLHLNNHVSDLHLEIKRVAWTAMELLTRIVFTDMKDLFLTRFEGILDGAEDSFPIFSSILRTLEDYLIDLKANLLPEYFRMLVLSCCHKLIHR